MRTFEAEYRTKTWTLADAFHRNPLHGRHYRKGKDNGEHSDSDLVDQAKKACPGDCNLWRVTITKPEKRDVWMRSLDGSESYASAAAPEVKDV